MKISAENIKNYLKFTHQVLGVSHIFTSSNVLAEKIAESEKKKIFNFYHWPAQKTWTEFSLENQTSALGKFQNVFIFFSDESKFENSMRSQTELLSKMNQALNGQDSNLLLGWLSSNAERDFFEKAAQWTTPLRIIFFRDDVSSKDTLYTSGLHRILETLTPLTDPNDQQRKRHIWNDFKRLLAVT